MDPTAPFLVRRVLVGVVVGLVLVSLAFYGWVQYRTAQYHDRVAQVVARYHRAYVLCVDQGGTATDCAVRVTGACTRDTFWAGAEPFATVPGTDSVDAATRCRSVPAG
jgi:hypothetical protein